MTPRESQHDEEQHRYVKKEEIVLLLFQSEAGSSGLDGSDEYWTI